MGNALKVLSSASPTHRAQIAQQGAELVMHHSAQISAFVCPAMHRNWGEWQGARPIFAFFLKMKISNQVGLILSAKLCPPFSLNLPPYFIFICLMTCNHYIIMIAFICYFPSTSQFSFGSPNPETYRILLFCGGFWLSVIICCHLSTNYQF